MRELTDGVAIKIDRPDHIGWVVDALRANGLAFVTGVADRASVLGLGRALVTVRPHPDGDPDGVTTIVQRTAAVRHPGMAGFSDRELAPHTDGSAVPQPPRVLIMACLRPASGGYSIMVDGRAVYEELVATDPAMLSALCEPRSVHFGAGAGYAGSVFHRHPGGRVTIRLRLDNLARFSPMVGRYVDRLRVVLDRHVRFRQLGAGDACVLMNDRWLHGRSRFEGDRLMLRIAGDPLPQHALPAGFLPLASIPQLNLDQG